MCLRLRALFCLRALVPLKRDKLGKEAQIILRDNLRETILCGKTARETTSLGSSCETPCVAGQMWESRFDE